MTTRVLISTSGQEWSLPGNAWTPDQVATSFAGSVPGIAGMQSVVTTSGEDKTITFSPKTGTKG